MNVEDIRQALESPTDTQVGSAVLIPLIVGQDGIHVLFEVRALTLSRQPGEVCLPGGHVEPGESAAAAAIRETCEELLVCKDQIELIGSIGVLPGPGGRPLRAFVGRLDGYENTFSKDEVDRTFTISLEWLLSHEPTAYRIKLEPTFPPDFPWEAIPGGRDYHWSASFNDVPFYPDTDPLLWGVTARVIMRLCDTIRKGGKQD